MIGWVSLYEVLAFMDKHIQRPKIKTFLLAPPPLFEDGSTIPWDRCEAAGWTKNVKSKKC